MAMAPEKHAALKKLIDESINFEGRYYLMSLYETLLESKKPKKELDSTADDLIELITQINILKNSNATDTARSEALKQISLCYQSLVKKTGTGGVFYSTKQVVLGLGGVLLGIIIAIAGAFLGTVNLVVNDVVRLQIPSGAFWGAITGMMVGFMIGFRAPDKLKDNETRSIQHSIKNLATTFDSLYSSVESDHKQKLCEAILTEYFSGDKAAFEEFLHGEHQYEILGAQASFLNDRLKGFVGHHSFIKFTINNAAKPTMLEFGTPTEDYTTSQSETRQATGEKLIDMLVMHGLLQEQYALNFQNLPTVLNRYEAGVNDCHTYVDKILISVGEPVSTIKRFTQDDRVLGQVVGAALSFFSPSNKKPQDSSHRIAAEPSEPTDKNGPFKQ